jgi:hypothetical protein
MISKCLLFFFISITILYGCGSDKKDPLVFRNDFESVKGWYDAAGISGMRGHSDMYSLYTDSSRVYSQTFKIKFKDVSGKRIKGVTYTLWCYADALPIKGSVVTSVKNDKDEQLVYNGNDLENFINDAGEWSKVSGKIDFKAHESDPENELGFYIWNTGKNKIFADDVTIRFIE